MKPSSGTGPAGSAGVLLRSRVIALGLALLPGILIGGGAPRATTGEPHQDAAASPAAAFSRFEFVAPQMGTLFRITVHARDAGLAERGARAAFARVRELNRVFSDYDPDSEAMRLCRAPRDTAVPVSGDLWTVLRLSQDLAARSGGAFDVTIGTVSLLWREVRRTRRLPTEAGRAAALRAAGHAQLLLDEPARTATLLVPGLRLDFGGIAKGYAADAALAVLRAHGLPHAMVAASGDLALGDAPPGAPGWKVALEPFGRDSRTATTLVAANVGVSTSGDAEQFVEIGGRRYSHVIDPRTGLGLTERVAVTVVAASGVRADSLATVGSVLAAGDETRLAACLGDGARALVLHRDREGKIVFRAYGTNPPGVRAGW